MFQINIDYVPLNVRILNATARDLLNSHRYCLCTIWNAPERFQVISFPDDYCQRLYCETIEGREAFSIMNNYLSNISCTPPLPKVNVKCTLVQALRLCTGRTAQRRSRGIALPFHDHGTRRLWSVSVTPRPLFTPGKDPVPTVQEAGWAPGPVWTGAENLVPQRDSIPRPSGP